MRPEGLCVDTFSRPLFIRRFIGRIQFADVINKFIEVAGRFCCFDSPLIEQYELCGKNPSKTGKTKAVYTAIHNQARLLLADKLEAVAAAKVAT